MKKAILFSFLALPLFLLASIMVADAADTAKIIGKVHFEGNRPEEKKINMSADPMCQKLHPEGVMTQHFLVNEDKTLQNVFVYVKEGLGDRKYEPPKEPVVLDQQGCWYHPQVFGIQVGQTLLIRNSDETLHNVHGMPAAKENKEFNLGMPMKGMELKRKFNEPEIMVKFKCDVHPWMFAYIGVLPHPFFSTTGKEGTFEIANLPAGEYVIEAWHKKLGTLTQKVTVGEGETKNVDFTMKADSIKEE